MLSYWGVDHGDTISKADNDMSPGRKAAATVFGPYHSAAAAKKGKKVRATARTMGYGAAGGTPGAVALSAGLTRGNPALAGAGVLASAGGQAAGNYRALKVNNRKGYYYPER